jgi:hypothetical protein
MAAKNDQHVQQQVAEVAGVESLEALLILGIEVGAATCREAFRLASIHLVWCPAAVLPPIDQAGELPRWPALLVEASSLDQLL